MVLFAEPSKGIHGGQTYLPVRQFYVAWKNLSRF